MPPKRYRKKGKAKVSKAVKKYVKKALIHDAEVKRIDTWYSGAYITQVGNMYYLSGINQGTNDYNRIANSIKPIKLFIRGWVQDFTNATVDVARIIVFQYKQTSNNTTAGATSVIVAPTGQDILEDSTTGASTYSNLTGIKLENRKAVHLLYDKSVCLIGSNTGSNAATGRYFSINISGKRMLQNIQYLSTGNTVASSGANAVYMLVLTAGHNVAQIYFNSQLSYIDK